MKDLLTLLSLSLAVSVPSFAVDLYGATPTADSVALGGIYFGSLGPTDSLGSNPAGLSFSQRPTLELTGMGILAAGSFRNSTGYPGQLMTKGSIAGSAGFSTGIPGTKLTVGVAELPTAMLSGKWRYMDPTGVAGVSYGVQTSKSAFLGLQTSMGASYKVSEWLSLGAAFGIVHNINTLETPYIFQTNPTLAGLKAMLDLHTQGNGYNGTFGAIVSPARGVSIGLSYKTRTAVRSFGTATGNTTPLFNALGVTSSSSYAYQAQVDNVFPQSASVALAWKPKDSWTGYLQGDWLNWQNAFTSLPVFLTSGNNVVLNGLLGSTTLNDSVPLHWRNQIAVRCGLSVPVRESFHVEGAYAFTNNPVPSSTLSPLTAAISQNAVSSGVTYTKSRYRIALGYQVNLPSTATVGSSALLAGEYNNTRTRVWLQTIALTTGVRF